MSSTNGYSRVDTAWRGPSRAEEERQVQHQWQAGAERQSRRSWWRSRGLRLGIWLSLFLALLGSYVVRLLLARPRIPVIAAVATEYDWPLTPNAWAGEDLESLERLENVQLLDSSPAWRSRSSGLRELSRQLELAAAKSPRGPLVVYISMHSAVSTRDGVAVACLLPPGCDPLDESTWLPLEQIIKEVQRLAQKREKLLVLDCQQKQLNPRIGQLANQFVGLVPAAIRAAKGERLAVLTSADSGQQRWASSGLHGSIFGRSLCNGLAGQADRGSMGNQDGYVSLGELHEYVTRHVSQWSAANRDTLQTPRLLGTTDSASALVWAPRSTPATPASSAPLINAVAIDELWQRNERLRTYRRNGQPLPPYGRYPIGWQQLQHQLMMLEELAAAGPTYGKRLADLAEKIEKQLAEVESRLAASSSAESAWDALAHASEPIAGAMVARSLPMGELLGTLGPADVQEIRAALDAFANQPSRQRLREAVPQLAGLANGQSLALAETHRLRLLDKYVAPDWTPSADVHRAVRLSGKSEALAAPLDHRCWPWLQPLIEAGDQARRPVEDGLLSPDQLRDPNLQSLLDTAEAKYEQAIEQQTRAASALGARDQVWDEIIYVCEWFLRYGAHRQVDDRGIPGRVATLIRHTHLVDLLVAKGGALAELQDETGQLAVARQWRELRDAFDRDIQSLADRDSPTAGDVRDIEAALKLPILLPAQRVKLRTVLAKYEEHSSGPAPATDQLSYVAWLEQHWLNHPVAGLISGPRANESTDAASAAASTGAENANPSVDGTASENPSWTTSGEDVELSQMARLGAHIRAELRGLSQSQATPDGDTEADEIQSLVRRAQWARIAASLAGAPRRHDPVARRWRASLRTLLLWHAQRAEQDLLGPVDAGETPFFMAASQDYQDDAGMLEPIPAEAARRMSLQRAQLAAQLSHALDVSASAELRADDQPTVRVQCKVSPPAEAAPNAATFGGRPALLVRDREQSPIAFGGLLSMTEGKEETLQVDANIIARQGAQLQAVAVLRGHEFVTSFEVEGLHGVRVQFAPAAYDRTEVTVRPSQRRGKSIVFVLDCSASMAESLPGEADQKLSRLEIAKSRLQGVLDQVAARADMRVGVRFFGHRVGWTNAEPLEVRVQENYLSALLKDVGPAEREVLEQTIRSLPPSQDVESMLKPGVFGAEELQRVRLRMKSLAPWGQSPLYLALTQAGQDLANEPPEYEKSIVVITDGLNYQWMPQELRSTAPENATLRDVLDQYEQRPAPITIVGFGLRESERAEAQQVYGQLAEATEGSYLPVDRVEDLLATLRGVVAQQSYGVRDEAGQWIGVPGGAAPGLAKVGTPLAIVPSPRAPRKVVVAVPPHLESTVELEGGEALELSLSQDRRELVATPFDDQVAGSATTVDALNAPTGHVLRIHRPSTTANGLEFLLSLQKQRSLFTPRPRDVWVEVTPLSDGGQALQAPWVLYDPNFAANMPVPVLPAKLEGWPREAVRAEVRSWFREQRTVPGAVTPIADVLADPAKFSQFQPVPGGDGATYQTHLQILERGRVLVRVLVQYPNDQTPPVRPWLETGNLRLTLVTRQFDHHHRLDSHRFDVAADDLSQLKSCNLEFTTRKAVQLGAFRQSREISFPVFRVEDTLPLNSAAGNP